MNYNKAQMDKRSTEWLEAKVSELSAIVARESKGAYARTAYHAQMGREQRVRSLALYSSALADRRAEQAAK
jgi:hypothetical protein